MSHFSSRICLHGHIWGILNNAFSTWIEGTRLYSGLRDHEPMRDWIQTCSKLDLGRVLVYWIKSNVMQIEAPNLKQSSRKQDDKRKTKNNQMKKSLF